MKNADLLKNTDLSCMLSWCEEYFGSKCKIVFISVKGNYEILIIFVNNYTSHGTEVSCLI